MDAQAADNWSLVILIAAPIVAYVIARALALGFRATLALGVMLAAAGGFVIDGYLLHPVDIPYGLGLGVLQVPLSAVAGLVVWRVRARSVRKGHSPQDIKRRRGEHLGANIQPPRLFTLCGCGATFYGHTDDDPQTSSYVTTYWFTVIWLPVSPIGRYRGVPRGTQVKLLGRETRYAIIGSAPLRRFDWFVVAIVWWGVGGLLLYWPGT